MQQAPGTEGLHGPNVTHCAASSTRGRIEAVAHVASARAKSMVDLKNCMTDT